MKTCRILLVDDEVEFARTLAERLEIRGFAVGIAHDGEEALRQVKADPPQVVVLDVMMPGLSGIEVLQRIKGGRRDLPVILLTGHGSTKDGMEGMRQGAFDYLIKPLDINDLIKKVHEALGKAGA